MKVENTSRFVLAGQGTDGRYYAVKPGETKVVDTGLVNRQKWIAKGLAIEVRPEIKTAAKKEPVKKEPEKKSWKKTETPAAEEKAEIE